MKSEKRILKQIETDKRRTNNWIALMVFSQCQEIQMKTNYSFFS